MKKIICFFMLILISSTNIVFAGNFKIGDKGQDVKDIQNKLSSCGYGVGSCGADGIFGKGTADAVKRFQRDYGLKPDGIVGTRTYQALFGIPGKNQVGPVPFTISKKMLAPPTPEPKRRTLRQGDSGQDVKEVQLALIRKGYSIGSYGADSQFGTATKEAIKQFQRDNNLNADGIVGPATWRALSRSGSAKASNASKPRPANQNTTGRKIFSDFCKSHSKPKSNIALMANPNKWIDLGKGWKMQVHTPKYAPDNPNVKPHFHVNKRGTDKGSRMGTENVDGTPSHGEKGLDDIPEWVKEKARNYPDVKKEREKMSGESVSKTILNHMGNNLGNIGQQIKDALKAGQNTINVGGTLVAITTIIAAFPFLALI